MGIKLKRWSYEPYLGTEMYLFNCPGCKYTHPIHVKWDPEEIKDHAKFKYYSHPTWVWNGSMTAPTFSPSLLVNKSYPKKRCHSFITNGKIQFLDNCFHDLKGKTVDIPDWKEDE